MADEFIQSIVDQYSTKEEQKVDEQPKGEQPVVENKPTTEPVKTEIVWNAEEFGGKNIDEVKQALSKFGEYESQVTGLRQKVTEYEERVKEQANKPLYKNPTFYKLEKIAEQEPENAELYQRLTFGNINDQELFKLGFLLEYPEYKERPDVVQRKLEQKFPILFDPDADKESVEYQDALVDLEIEAKRVKKTLTSKLDSIEVPDPAKLEAANREKLEAFAQTWKPTWDILIKNNKIPINVLSEKDKKSEVLFDVELSPEESGKYFDQAARFIFDKGLQPNEESIKTINQFIQKLYVAEHFEELTTKVATHVEKANGKNWRNAIHNPSAPGAQPIVENNIKPDREREVLDDFFKNH